MSQPSPEALVTTVIPTYRRPKLLRRAIRSVLRQTYPHFQVCVYDNASGDETAAVVQELAATDPRVRYHCHERNIGGMANYRYGFDHVTTPFFCTLGDDDALLPNFFEMALAGFDKFPEAACSACGSMVVDGRGRVLQVVSWPSGLYPPPQAMFAMLKHWFAWQGYLFRQEAIQITGGLDEKVGGPADFDFLLRLAALRPFAAQACPAALVRHGDDSLSSIFRFSDYWPQTVRMIRKIEADERIPPAVRAELVRLLRDWQKFFLFRTIGLRSILDECWEDVTACATALEKELGCRRAGFLKTLGGLCRRFPAARYGLQLIRGARRVSARIGNLPAQWKYRRLIKAAGM